MKPNVRFRIASRCLSGPLSIRSPSRWTDPPSGVSSRPRTWSRVLLPDPLDPTMATSSRARPPGRPRGGRRPRSCPCDSPWSSLPPPGGPTSGNLLVSMGWDNLGTPTLDQEPGGTSACPTLGAKPASSMIFSNVFSNSEPSSKGPRRKVVASRVEFLEGHHRGPVASSGRLERLPLRPDPVEETLDITPPREDELLPFPVGQAKTLRGLVDLRSEDIVEEGAAFGLGRPVADLAAEEPPIEVRSLDDQGVEVEPGRAWA